MADLNNLLFTTEMNSVEFKTIEQCIECVDIQPQVVNDTNVGSRREWYQKGYQDGLNADKWIPCSERLPKYSDEFNVTIGVANEFGYYERVTTLRYERIKGKEPRWVIPKNEVCNVIAWQPLPQPYKKEGAD